MAAEAAMTGARTIRAGVSCLTLLESPILKKRFRINLYPQRPPIRGRFFMSRL